ncbi:TIM barrel protein [Metabacillus sediminilitoris]|uniref:Sugar phosphate isomerase/epimerase n=1 Tax=Metabacillus sediminilitoris TaxID=2567941 RepID=A0A4S4C1H1_9BACI|nr:TIM barrel protein [Metabacillus sediminilitoris]QGQ48215.1 sugar phosphate isomerase/epimerase [Metabacillus sediminilitoris]THF81425.1 sugar phosphate isomerase/epimerase [Metabacillus sediminilitoris]
MKNIRLKSSLEQNQIQNRLKYKPEILELHINEENLYEPEKLVSQIRAITSEGIRVYLHHPSKFKGEYLDIISSSKEMRDFYDWSSSVLASICKQEKIKCIIHCHYAKSESSKFVDQTKRIETRKRIEEILRISDQCFLWEDTIRGIFSAGNPHLLEEIVQPLNLPLNIDISHSFIALQGENHQLHHHLETYHRYAHYYHLVDSKGLTHDSLPLGKGNIDWKMVKSYVKDTDFIFEIDLKESNYLDCSPMIESAKYFNRLDILSPSKIF